MIKTNPAVTGVIDAGLTGVPAERVAVEGVATGVITVPQAVYTSHATGPRVEVVIPNSGRVLVILTGELSGSNTNSAAYMSVSLDGSTALDTNSLRVKGSSPVRASVIVLLAHLTPGTKVVFEAVYKLAGNGSATFNARQITVIPN